jgi:hypothetical protein
MHLNNLNIFFSLYSIPLLKRYNRTRKSIKICNLIFYFNKNVALGNDSKHPFEKDGWFDYVKDYMTDNYGKTIKMLFTSS